MLLDDDNLPILNVVVKTGATCASATQHKQNTVRNDDLDRRIDRLIEKHMTALRVDIKIALTAYANQKPE